MRTPSLRHRPALLPAGVLLAGALAAPTAPTAPTAPADSRPAASPVRGKACLETRLFFGTARPDGEPAVTDRQFAAFVDKVVTPDFPDGLTVQSGRGQWRDAHGTIEKERSYELVLLCPRSATADGDRKIEEIRRAYEKAFAQESVGRVDERVRVDF
ncbi:DUF3574 domain-containing protein [Streptomyces sp. NPDC101237]|uniref:DUF3574 domain-containing protein n=1 Tax=Streptomyces sp. NPDC101237 TaxID=3366139 RepID=UPI00381DE76E